MDAYSAFCLSLRAHPDIEIRDAVKFMYQSEFGGGHMINDEASSLLRLKEELEAVTFSSAVPMVEPLGEKTARVNLAAVKGKISAETLNRLFVMSANSVAGSLDSFLKKLDILYDFFPKHDIDSYLSSYSADGYPAVSHTESYREAYSPSYRVISAEFVPILPILAEIDAKRPRLVAIDGRCASGKTTLSNTLSKIYDCNIFHADDFFLPPEMRTTDRLSTPGGNLHRERLYDEILLPIKEKRTAFYRKFFCDSCTLSDYIAAPDKALNIVEGSYSMHPELFDMYDLRIFLDIDKDLQLSRLRLRESEESLATFISRWIPLEEAYFSVYGIRSRADVVISARS